MSHESKPILLGECSTRKETQRPSLARSLAAGHKWRACSQANTHALVKPCKYNQDISQQYGTNICNQCKRSTCRSWRVTQVVLATSELATCYESSDIHQSARIKVALWVTSQAIWTVSHLNRHRPKSHIHCVLNGETAIEIHSTCHLAQTVTTAVGSRRATLVAFKSKSKRRYQGKDCKACKYKMWCCHYISSQINTQPQTESHWRRRKVKQLE